MSSVSQTLTSLWLISAQSAALRSNDWKQVVSWWLAEPDICLFHFSQIQIRTINELQLCLCIILKSAPDISPLSYVNLEELIL